MRTMKKRSLRLLLLTFATVAFISIVPNILFQPSLSRNWTEDQKILARTTFNKDGTVSIENIRNIDYRSTADYTTRYYDASYDPRKIIRAWFLVEPFESFGAAHTLVSFEFDDGRFLSISAEIRKEIGEAFSPFKGMLNQYELVYVVADEKDVVRLRTNYRKDKVYLYPIKTKQEKVRAVFIDMLKRANSLAKKPEMYNTLTSNCTTNIVSHVRKFSADAIPWWDFRYLFPATVDKLVYDAGLIDTDLSIEKVRERFFITPRAQENDQNLDFSRVIRGE